MDNIFDQTKSETEELNHTINDEYFITHVLAGLPKEYASVVDQAKIDRRTSSLSLRELRKRLIEKYRQLMNTMSGHMKKCL